MKASAEVFEVIDGGCHRLWTRTLAEADGLQQHIESKSREFSCDEGVPNLSVESANSFRVWENPEHLLLL